MKLKKFAIGILIFIIWILLWWGLSVSVNLQMLLPSPSDTFNSLIELGKTKNFYQSVIMSLLRISIGFISGVVIGSFMGGITFYSKILNVFFQPIFHIVKATPVASFIILAIVWLKSQNIPSFISMLIVVPFVWSNVKTGFENTDKKLIETADFFRVGIISKLKNIYFPSVKPYFVSSVSTAMGLAWKAGIAAEVLCYPEYSIGKGIYNSKIYILTPELFAWTFVVIVLSIILEKSMLYILERNKND